MIAPWMLYCVAVGVLLSACAAALDGALRPLGRPTRGTWMAALVLTLALPAAVRMFGGLPPVAPRPAATPPMPPASATKTAADAPVTLPRIAPPALPRGIDVRRLEVPLATLWIGSSAAGALVLAALAGALARRRRGWAPAEVDGVPVLVSGDVGPAVVGLLRSRIVLPRWVVDGDAEARALVLEHEREHVRAGDPRLLACALLLAVLTPWNPAVWWQLRRLRLAVEADCDARVLRRRGDVRAYGAVLLEVGRRASRSGLAAAAAFAEPVSTLERRIRIMTAPRARRPLLRAAALGALAAALAAVACETPAPTLAPPAAPRTDRFDPRSAVREYFPDVARGGMGADEYLVFVVSADGRMLRHQRVPGGEFAAIRVAREGMGGAQLYAAATMRRPAGELAPTPVQLMWYRLKGPEDDPSVTTITRDVPPSSGEPGPMRTTVVVTAGAQAFIGMEGITDAAGTPDVAALRAALERYSGPTARGGTDEAAAQISFTVAADGRPRDVKVRAKPDAVEPVARGVVAALRFPAAAASHDGELLLHLGADHWSNSAPR